MSRIGRMPIPVPKGVTVTVGDDNTVHVKGPKGEISRQFDSFLTIREEEGAVHLERESDDRHQRAVHGLSRSLLNNMVVGVTEGHSKALLVTGIGYRAEQVGRGVSLQVGLSHPVLVYPDEGIELKAETANRVSVSGVDKELVGDVAARIRSVRPIKPYIFRGDFQGIRYETERPRRKAGKQGV